MNKELKSIIYEWKHAAGVNDLVTISSFPRSTLIICTTRPGLFIGRRGVLVDVYREKLRKILPDLEHIEFVETDSYFFR